LAIRPDIAVLSSHNTDYQRYHRQHTEAGDKYNVILARLQHKAPQQFEQMQHQLGPCLLASTFRLAEGRHYADAQLTYALIPHHHLAMPIHVDNPTIC
jgi:hypothetical protein